VAECAPNRERAAASDGCRWCLGRFSDFRLRWSRGSKRIDRRLPSRTWRPVAARRNGPSLAGCGASAGTAFVKFSRTSRGTLAKLTRGCACGASTLYPTCHGGATTAEFHRLPSLPRSKSRGSAEDTLRAPKQRRVYGLRRLTASAWSRYIARLARRDSRGGLMRSGASVMRRQPSLFGSYVARLWPDCCQAFVRLLSDCCV